MQPDAAATASQTDSQPFLDENINSLDTDMTDAELEAFVDRTLGPQPTIKDAFGNSSALPTPNDIANGDKSKTNEKTPESSKSKEDKQESPENPTGTERKEEPKERVSGTADDAEERQLETPAEVPTVDNSDLWIEIKGVKVDAEGNQTDETVRITVDGELPDDFRFKNDKELAEYLDALKEMRDLRTERQSEYDKAVAEREQQIQQTQSESSNQTQMVQRWDQEIADLTQAGLLEPPKVPPANGQSYTKEEIEADPALQRLDSVYIYIAEENGRRQREGKALLSSFAAAFNLFQKQEQQIEADKQAKAQDEEIKRKGAMVGGGSGVGAGGSGKDYVYKAGSAKSIYAVDTSDL